LSNLQNVKPPTQTKNALLKTFRWGPWTGYHARFDYRLNFAKCVFCL